MAQIGETHFLAHLIAQASDWSMWVTGLCGDSDWSMWVTGLCGDSDWSMWVTGLCGDSDWSMWVTGLCGDSDWSMWVTGLCGDSDWSMWVTGLCGDSDWSDSDWSMWVTGLCGCIGGMVYRPFIPSPYQLEKSPPMTGIKFGTSKSGRHYQGVGVVVIYSVRVWWSFCEDVVVIYDLKKNRGDSGGTGDCLGG
ncbi:hypothetical protein DPMN_123026 [Dreissena polymorpha]|uniref:Uncharacterized protein n=1 Tax=Dreissena polymorpha TaxID=45954 RepID=A0A9D4GSX8_DREPO|nr:hypothetical protein DPMN_123026 [Dreissena polymorpha]